MALMPDSLKDVADENLVTELSNLDNSKMPLPEKVRDILESIWIDIE